MTTVTVLFYVKKARNLFAWLWNLIISISVVSAQPLRINRKSQPEQNERKRKVCRTCRLAHLFVPFPSNSLQFIMLARSIQHFVFGYGSLICPHSRAITAPDQAHKIATPVVVHGVERTWSKRTNRGMTAMGVRFSTEAECVGVLLPVNDQELSQFDEREMGYDRVALNLDNVSAVPFLEQDEHYEDDDVFLQAKERNNTETIQIWVYVPQRTLPPAPEHPIVQTYVDTILRGCLSISEEFAKEFIETTKGWHPDELSSQDSNESDSDASDEEAIWVDDRQDPVYIRGDPKWSRSKAKELDLLLQTHRPDQFSNRRQLDVLVSQ
jgi:cation transport regulator ChaC